MPGCRERLAPIPAPGALKAVPPKALREALVEVAQQKLARAGLGEPAGRIAREARRFRHSLKAVSRPSVMFRRASSDCRSARWPAVDNRKCFFRRPPRSGVGSPIRA